MADEADMYEIGGLSVIQHGGNLYVAAGSSLYPIQGGSLYPIEGGSLYAIQGGDGVKSWWRKLSPLAHTFRPIVNDLVKQGKQSVKDLGKRASDQIVQREDRIVQAAQETVDNFKSKPSSSTVGSGIREALTPAQRKSYDKATRKSKNN